MSGCPGTLGLLGRTGHKGVATAYVSRRGVAVATVVSSSRRFPEAAARSSEPAGDTTAVLGQLFCLGHGRPESPHHTTD